MNKLWRAYKEKWFVPIIFACICGIIGLITISIQNEIVLYLSLGIPFLALLVSGFLGLLRIIKKNYKTGILQIVLSGIIGVIGLFLVSLYLMFYPYDYYADSLKIPNNIDIYIPKAETFEYSNKTNPETNHIPKDKDFELYNSFQPGLYTYDIWLSKIDSGKLYLKVYEITKNDRLSQNILSKKSEIVVGHPIDTIIKYGTKDHFTIYEGDWGKPYAARFEIWYKRNNSDQEIKLLEKNYKIEGWQR
ncbi:hypothetical protein GOQ30_18080 [Flavobacterium sp. TP390]|uniref:Uncharacterized protein n=1 Tax=Flavobacterium profundi TaxID=1774945 RepID=A0A6I4IW19_9FLAO|nr:hypothetical protein [Flavobacterium profundi]MVO11083.1 hypothetical protein [Flavobacterium profundi]